MYIIINKHNIKEITEFNDNKDLLEYLNDFNYKVYQSNSKAKVIKITDTIFNIKDTKNIIDFYIIGQETLSFLKNYN